MEEVGVGGIAEADAVFVLDMLAQMKTTTKTTAAVAASGTAPVTPMAMTAAEKNYGRHWHAVKLFRVVSQPASGPANQLSSQPASQQTSYSASQSTNHR